MASSNSNLGSPGSALAGFTMATVTGVKGASSSGQGTATLLSNAQTNQILQHLRAIQATSGSVSQAIKIQAIHTNPQTGVKQFVAIPVQAGAPGARVSPMKVIKLPASMASGSPAIAQVVSTASATSMSPGVKVVKLAAGPSRMVTTCSSATNVTVTGSGSHYQPPQVLTPTKLGMPGSSIMDSDGIEASATGGSQLKRSDYDLESLNEAKRRKTEKGGKGLRHFSMKVCEKVQAKGSTSYNEVADELVNELTDTRCASPTDQQYDQKNIRRRVYDALNVLMAMNIISKEKKEIRWLGLPTNLVQEANSLELDKTKRMDRIKAKTQQLQDLILQQIAFKNLVERNKEREKREGAPAPNSAIQLPFVIVNTSRKTVIDCSISNDKMEYLFNFDDTFEIHDDMEVLKRMGLSLGLERGQVSAENLAKARTMVPRALEQYVIDLANNGPGACPQIPKVSTPKLPAQDPLMPSSAMESRYSDAGETDSDVDIN